MGDESGAVTHDSMDNDKKRVMMMVIRRRRLKIVVDQSYCS